MAKNRSNTTEHNIDVKVNLKEINQFSDKVKGFEDVLKKFSLTLKNSPGLYEFLGTLKAIEHQINDLARNKNFKEVARLIATTNSAIDTVNNNISASAKITNKPKEYKMKDGVTKRSVSHGTISQADLNVLNASAEQWSKNLKDDIMLNNVKSKQLREMSEQAKIQQSLESEIAKTKKEQEASDKEQIKTQKLLANEKKQLDKLNEKERDLDTQRQAYNESNITALSTVSEISRRNISDKEKDLEVSKVTLKTNKEVLTLYQKELRNLREKYKIIENSERFSDDERKSLASKIQNLESEILTQTKKVVNETKLLDLLKVRIKLEKEITNGVNPAQYNTSLLKYEIHKNEIAAKNAAINQELVGVESAKYEISNLLISDSEKALRLKELERKEAKLSLSYQENEYNLAKERFLIEAKNPAQEEYMLNELEEEMNLHSEMVALTRESLSNTLADIEQRKVSVEVTKQQSKEDQERIEKAKKLYGIQTKIAELQGIEQKHATERKGLFDVMNSEVDDIKYGQLKIKYLNSLVAERSAQYKIEVAILDAIEKQHGINSQDYALQKKKKEEALEILTATQKNLSETKVDLAKAKSEISQYKMTAKQKAQEMPQEPFRTIDPFQKEKSLIEQDILLDKIKQKEYDIEDIENNISSQRKNGFEKYQLEMELHEKRVELAELEVELAKKHYNTIEKQSEIEDAAKDLELKKEALESVENTTKEFKKQREELSKSRKGLLSIIADFFSLEKLVARISFVLTAKFSYSFMNFFSRLPKQAVDVWIDFQDEISKVYGLITDKSGVFKNQLENTVISLSTTYGIAAKKVASAMYEIVSAQVPMQHAGRVLEQAIKLSRAGGTDLTGAARSLVQIANAYEVSFDKMSRISDVAFQTIKYGQLTMEQYTEEMQKVISTASIFKISQEEISAAIATMTINGIGANQAFTSLNQMLMQIANPTKQATNLMEQLGISLSIKDIQEKGLGYALESLIPLLDSTDQHGRELISILFKSRTGFKAVASLLQNMGQYGDYYINMLDSAGATSNALAERTQTVSYSMEMLKTEWQNMLIMAAKSQDSGLIGFLNSITNNIKYLSNNAHLLYLALKMILAQIGTFFIVAIGKGIVAISQLRQGFRTLASVATSSAQAVSAAWASTTLGLSVLIQILVQMVHWIGEAGKKAEKVRIDKILHIDEANESLEKANQQLDELNYKISKLEGMKKMVSMYEQISKKQNKSNKEIERMDKLFNDVEKTMGKMGIQIDGTGTKLERLAKYTAEINKELGRYAKLDFFARTMKTIGEGQQAARDFALKKPGLAHKISPEHDVDMLEQEYKRIGIYQSVTGGFATQNTKRLAIIKDYQNFRNNKDSIYGNAYKNKKSIDSKIAGLFNESGKRAAYELFLSRAELFLSQASDAQIKIQQLSESEDFETIIKTLETEKSNTKLWIDALKEMKPLVDDQYKHEVDKSIHILAGILSTQIGILAEAGKIGLEDALNIPNWDVVNVGTEKKSEKSFYKQFRKILEDILRKPITDSVEAVWEAHKEALDDLMRELNDFDGTEKDKTLRNQVLEKIHKLQSELFSIETIKSFSDELSHLAEFYDIAIKAGDKDKAEKIFQEMGSLYETFVDGISKIVGNIDNLKNSVGASGNKIFSDAEIKQLERYGEFALDQITSAFLGGISKTKMAHTFDSKRIAEDGELSDYSAVGFKKISTLTIDEMEKILFELSKETLDEEQTILFEALSILRDERIKLIENTLRKNLKIEDTPEWFNTLSNSLSEAVSQGKITSRSQFVKARDSFLKDNEVSLTKSQKKEIDKIFPDVSWLEAMGMKKYEDEGDIASDMANRTIDSLQQVWSFYWDWEIRKLQEQQQKKLDILESEKKMMLANTLMSNEQKAIIEERFQERQRQLQEKLDREMARKKKQQAMFDASIDFAKGLIGIWSYYLGRGRPVEAALFSALLTAIFGTQMAMINNQKFASGGLTGSGYGRPDETGHRPAGIVHAGELVIDKKTLDRNFNELTGLYSSLKSGKSFNNAVSQYMQGGFKGNLKPGLGSFAQGGLVGGLGLNSLKIDLGGIRTIDDVGLAKIVMNGNRKIRIING